MDCTTPFSRLPWGQVQECSCNSSVIRLTVRAQVQLSSEPNGGWGRCSAPSKTRNSVNLNLTLRGQHSIAQLRTHDNAGLMFIMPDSFIPLHHQSGVDLASVAAFAKANAVCHLAASVVPFAGSWKCIFRCSNSLDLQRLSRTS